MTRNTTSFPRFVAAGEALTDLICSREQADQWTSKCGGATWNVARVVSSWGVPSAFAGAVSKDVFGDALREASRESHLDLRFLQQFEKSPLLAMVYSLDPPKYFFVGDDSADLHFDATQLPPGWESHCEWAHFGGISLAREPLAGKLVALARHLKARGVRISFDPNYRVVMDERFDATLRTMVQLADVIKVSDEDLRGLFRTGDEGQAFQSLCSWNPTAMVMLTRGAQGASLHWKGEQWRATPPAIEVVDTVGAGDASMGGLLLSLMQSAQVDAGADAGAHLRWAVASGAAACLYAGAGAPARDQIELLAQRTVVFR